jgi:hypothetical protein
MLCEHVARRFSHRCNARNETRSTPRLDCGEARVFVVHAAFGRQRKDFEKSDHHDVRGFVVARLELRHFLSPEAERLTRELKENIGGLGVALESAIQAPLGAASELSSKSAHA